jgi:sugar lactone lactonase YvrE
MTAAVDVVANDRALVGESPVWSVRERALYWLDGRSDAIYRIDANGARTHWTTPAKVNAIALRPGGLIVAMKSGIATLDTATGTFATIAVPEPYGPAMRMNDGKIDRAGRFWFGTMHDDAADASGHIYRLTGSELATIDRGYTIPNGFAWSPDDRRMYLADSELRTIFAYDYDLASGEARNRRAFAETPPGTMPDGATVDAGGYLWSARVGGASVARYAPDGTLDRVLELPVQRPTSVIFGGDDLRTLFITTASRRLSPEQLAAQPLAGAVLAVRVDVPGVPEPEFAAAGTFA